MAIRYKFTVIRKRYPKRLDRALLEAIYDAFTKYNETAHNLILEKAPISETPSKRWPKGFVKGHIKLVTHRKGRYHYKVVSVPGSSHKGSRAWRAWIAINALHYGWSRLDFPRTPTRRGALGLPVTKMRVTPPDGRETLPRKKAVQRKQLKLNPWIAKVWDSLRPHFESYLKRELDKQRAKKRTEKIA